MSFLAIGLTAASIAASVAPAAISGVSANKAKKRASSEARRRELELANLEKSRQEIINPYDQITNPMAALQVSTRAAEFQGEQTDIALANVLDTLRATGGAGGATALAIQAARSKEGIAADIAAQEVENERLRAQGQQQMEIYQAQGRDRAFQYRESRETAQLDRTQAQIDQEKYLEMMYNQQRINAISTGVGSAFESAVGGITAASDMGAFSGGQ